MTPRFPCGHPKTEKNTGQHYKAARGESYAFCRTCRCAYMRTRYWAAKGEEARP